MFGTSRFFFLLLLIVFFFWKPLYYHTDKKDTLNKNRNTTTKHSENSTCPTMFFFSPNHTNNSYSNYCGNIVKCYLTSFSSPSISFVSLLTKTCYKNRSFYYQTRLWIFAFPSLFLPSVSSCLRRCRPGKRRRWDGRKKSLVNNQ